ncbi:hypothetical protein NXW13_00760 [Bacteroides thetaiotaomicron]|nr:hypothetical protein [Bacteroides thetaiotaomicron]
MGCCHYTVTAYLVSYYGGLKIATMWHARFKTATLASVVAEKAHAVQLYISRAATLTYAAAQALLHKNTTRCTSALRLMRIELLKNPYTALLALLVAARVAIYQLAKKTETGFGSNEGPPGSCKESGMKVFKPGGKNKNSCSCYQ